MTRGSIIATLSADAQRPIVDALGHLEPVTFSVEGEPQGKGRARSFLQAGRIVTTTPPKTRTYEGLVRSAALDAFKGRAPWEGPLRVDLTAIFGIAKSWSKKKQQDALTGFIKPTKRPDLDNILKAFKDGMKGVIYRDDCQIVNGFYSKRYGPQAMVVVTVKPA